MESMLRQLKGKNIDVTCSGNAVFRGEVIEVSDGVLQLRNEDDKTALIAIDKISVVLECHESHSRPGFIG